MDISESHHKPLAGRFCINALVSLLVCDKTVCATTHAIHTDRIYRALLISVFVLLGLQGPLPCGAQTPQLADVSTNPTPQTESSISTPPANKPSNDPGLTPVKLENHPAWQDLSVEQQLALKPLQKLWPKMSNFQKQKWLVISKNYNNMGADEQSRLQSRMKEWVSLSNQERAAARLNYSEVNKLSEDQKLMKWEAYQALEPGVKQKLLSDSQHLPKGVAIALHPTNKALLTITPTKAGAQATRLPRIDVSQISHQTLLPIARSSIRPLSPAESEKSANRSLPNPK